MCQSEEDTTEHILECNKWEWWEREKMGRDSYID